MHLAYIDEAGSGELLDSRNSDSTPILVVAGLMLSEGQQHALAKRFLNLKKSFNPRIAEMPTLSELIKAEIKGSSLRSDMRSDSRNRRRYAIGFLDKLMSALEEHDCRLVARIYVKETDVPCDEARMYATCMTTFAQTLNHLAMGQGPGERALMLLDARTKWKNVGNVHTVTTHRYASQGNRLPALVESPMFGHSDTHLLLQVADLVASALLFPMAAAVYCSDMAWNTHCSGHYAPLVDRYGTRLKRLQYRYRDDEGSWMGGVSVSDRRLRRSASLMFQPARPDRVIVLPDQRDERESASVVD